VETLIPNILLMETWALYFYLARYSYIIMRNILDKIWRYINMKNLLQIFKDGRWLICIFPVAVLVIAVLTMTGIMSPAISFGCGIVAYLVAIMFSYDDEDED
jgi:hypothetical protein